jgi:hypothetical protein
MFETIRQALKCRVFVIYKCGVYYNGINTLIGRPGTWLQVIKMRISCNGQTIYVADM